MIITVEKVVAFDETSYAEDIVDHLYNMLEEGWQEEDWKCLTEEQQKAVVEEILTEAVRQGKGGRVNDSINL